MTDGDRSATGRTSGTGPWKRPSLLGLVVRVVLLAALAVLFNLLPQWVGAWMGMDGDPRRWRFLPLLAPSYSSYLPWLNLWWGAALLLDLELARRRRWSQALRWADLIVRLVGIAVLYRLLAGPSIVGVNPEWAASHPWLEGSWSSVEALAEPLGAVSRLVFLVLLAILSVSALRRLLLLAGFQLGLGPLAREAAPPRRPPEILDIFRKDARRAYAVLDRDGRFGEEPDGTPAKLIHRLKVLVTGVAGQLSPARRWLFILCLAAAGVNPSLWSLAACAGLFFLLLMELVERVTLRDELEIARDLQRELLPAGPPQLPGYEVATSWRTANEVGGDYHDFLPASHGRLALMVGDASGHGMAAGLLMAIASATLKAAVDLDPDPARVAAQLNRALHRAGGRRAFMAVFYGLLQPGSGHLDFVCAGQPFPLLLRAEGKVEEMGEGALPLGMRERARPSPASVDLAPGDRLVLFTDGLAEAVSGPEDEAFGFDRIRELAALGGGAQEIHDRILSAFDEHLAGRSPADDLTLVVIGRSS